MAETCFVFYLIHSRACTQSGSGSGYIKKKNTHKKKHCEAGKDTVLENSEKGLCEKQKIY